jgi:hypothetical protein
MAKISALFFILSIIGHDLILAADAKPHDVDTEELIRRLSSDDFTTRNSATDALSARAEKIWDRLEQLAKSKDLEISQRAKLAMSAPGQRELQAAIETVKSRRLAMEEEIKNAEARLNHAVNELSKKLALAEEETKALMFDTQKLSETEAAERTKQIAARNEAQAELFKKIEETKQKSDDVRIKYRNDFNRYETRLVQLTKLQECGEIIKPGTIDKWTPASWPFERRLKASVTFEFVDKPLTEALAFMADAAKLEIKFDPAAKGEKEKIGVTLRVQDMEAELAMRWLCRLAELEISIDQDNSRVMIVPPDQQ